MKPIELWQIVYHSFSSKPLWLVSIPIFRMPVVVHSNSEKLILLKNYLFYILLTSALCFHSIQAFLPLTDEGSNQLLKYFEYERDDITTSNLLNR